MKVVKSPSDALALTNCVIVHPADFDSNIKYIEIENEFVFTIRSDPSVPRGCLGTSNFHRTWAHLSLAQEVSVRPYDPLAASLNCYLGSLCVGVEFLRKMTETNETFDTKEMADIFRQLFETQVFSVGQKIVFDFHGIHLLATVQSLELVDFSTIRAASQPLDGMSGNASASGQRGILMKQTSISISKVPDSAIKLSGAAKASTRANNLLQPNFQFTNMGIGGLDDEFAAIFRRAFASRIFPPAQLARLGITHVKGILLFGPPGTGKTLMARQIGKMLNAREPKIVNGPEILNKFVGQSEENIRNLFKDAEAEYKQFGDDSQLHIIIFDELDAICKQRGSKNDGTGVGDSVVNQLLSKLDGVDQLNNILVIGMTNRLDMIDEALLRPGRLEVHMEIGLPDEKGRLQIFNIHTSSMRENKILHQDVDLPELARETKNFSGAEIGGLVKSASSFALNRHIKIGQTVAVDSQSLQNMKVMRQDFFDALDEVHAAFGVQNSEFEGCARNGILPFSQDIERILSDGSLFVQQTRNSERTPLVSVLLHGPQGSGKTALAARLALDSDFPFIKLISPENMVGFSEAAKVAAITKVFNDSYKSPLSVIVVDSIERLLEYVPIGPRFSNTILQVLLVLLKKTPPSGRKLLILATTNNRSLMDQMELNECFNATIHVPTVQSLASLDYVLKTLNVFEEQERKYILQCLESKRLRLSIGIKKLLNLIEMTRQEHPSFQVDKMLSLLQEEAVA